MVLVSEGEEIRQDDALRIVPEIPVDFRALEAQEPLLQFIDDKKRQRVHADLKFHGDEQDGEDGSKAE